MREDCLEASINLNWTELIDEGVGDEARAIVCDNDGNLYITGKIFNATTTSEDLIIAKYDTYGDQVWNRTWGGALSEIGYDLVINGTQEIYIVGSTQSFGNGSADMCLLKYDTFGNRLWNLTWGGAEWDEGYGLALDDDQHVYITGYSETIESSGDIVLLKYNGNGIKEWNVSLGGVGTETAYTVAVNDTNDIYLTGETSSFGPNGVNLLLAKFNSTGHKQWNVTWGGDMPDAGRSLFINQSREIYVVGNTESYGAENQDIILLKYNGTGHLQSQFMWGAAQDDYAYGIACNVNNQVIIAGTANSNEGINGDFLLVKLNGTHDELWNKTWGGARTDNVFGLTLDTENNIFIAGYSESYGDLTGDIVLSKFHPSPGDFILDSDAESPDPDGRFNVRWSASRDADNYTLFRHNKTITEINVTLTEVVKGNTNRSMSLELGQGMHYFIVVAFNRYGNISSNVLQVIVFFPPGGFLLTHTAEPVDPDGTFLLNWSKAERAVNYSVYRHTTFIHEIDHNGTLVASNITALNYSISNLNTSTYYYVIVAYNDMGQNMSNCVQITIGRVPLGFTVSADALEPETDGKFTLHWTASNFSDNYTIYYYSSPIYIFSTALSVYQFLTPLPWNKEGPFQISVDLSALDEGVYYLAIFARNAFGENISENIRITLDFPEDQTKDKKEKESEEINILPLILFPILLGGLITIYLIKKKKN